MLIDFASRETHALTVIAEACSRDPRWLSNALPDPADQLAVKTALAKLYGERVYPAAARHVPLPLVRIEGNRGRHHRSYCRPAQSGT